MSKKNKQKRKQSQRKDYHFQSTPMQPVQASQSVQTTPKGSLLTPVEGKNKPVMFGSSEEHIRTDIIRIITILGILLLVLVGTVIINRKTTLIHRAGSRFASFLQL